MTKIKLPTHDAKFSKASPRNNSKAAICRTTCTNGGRAECADMNDECRSGVLDNGIVIGVICDNKLYTCTQDPDKTHGAIIDLCSGSGADSGCPDVDSGADSGSGSGSGSGSENKIPTDSLEACEGKNIMNDCMWVDGGHEFHGHCQTLHGTTHLICGASRKL